MIANQGTRDDGYEFEPFKHPKQDMALPGHIILLYSDKDLEELKRQQRDIEDTARRKKMGIIGIIGLIIGTGLILFGVLSNIASGVFIGLGVVTILGIGGAGCYSSVVKKKLMMVLVK